MTLLTLLGILPTLLILVVGAGIAAQRLREPAALAGRSWITGLGDRFALPFGRAGGALLAVAAGTGVVLAVCWPLGVGARNSEAFDHAALRWVAPRAHEHDLVRVMRVLTKMGNNREMQVVAVVAGVVLSLLWLWRMRSLRAIVPLFVMLVAYELEHQLQHVLKLLAHRGHPPLTLGSYPSGGCARLVCIVGLAIFLGSLLLRRRSPVTAAAWTVLVAASYVEGFSRVYLSKHWTTDVLGGWIFGALLLGVLCVGSAMLLRVAPPQDVPPSTRDSQQLTAIG